MSKKRPLTEASAAADTLRPGGAPGEPRAKQITQIVDLLANMSDDDINKFKESIAMIGHEADGIPGDAAARNLASITPKTSAAVAAEAYAQDVDDMLSGEDLPEEFKGRAKVVFEAAVSLRSSLVEEEIRAENEIRLAEEIEEIEARLVEGLNKYLDYVADKFVSENALQLESTLRVAKAESLLEGLRTLFNEHNIEVPEGGDDLIASMQEEIDALEAALDNVVNENVELTAQLEESAREAIFNDVAEGLALTQVEKLRRLTEDLDFQTPETFRESLHTIRGKYFKSASPTTSTKIIVEEQEYEDVNDVVEEPVVSNSGSNRYLSALERLSKK